MTFYDFVLTVLQSKLLWTPFVIYLVTHIIKFFIYYIRYNVFSLKPFFDTGGMPSSHTATTVGMTVAVAFETGASPLFFVCGLFTLITIRDSYGVRRSVSDQAHILNALTSEMKIRHKAKIVLGHTPFQVAVGGIIGVLVALAMYLF